MLWLPDTRSHRVDFVSPKLYAQCQKLKEGPTEEQELYLTLQEAIQELKKNPSCGIRVGSRLWPKEYARLGITNLRKYDLPHGWRLIYTLTGDKIEIMAIILEWMSHKQYEKRFGYKVG